MPDKKRLLFIFNFLNLFAFFSEELRATAIHYLSCYNGYRMMSLLDIDPR